MKIKHAFIGNSSSASYYIRRGNYEEVDVSVDGKIVDCWKKWHPNNKWAQVARVDASLSGDITDGIEISFDAGAYVLSNAATSGSTADDFDPPGTPATNFSLPETPYSKEFTGPQVESDFVYIFKTNISGRAAADFLTGAAIDTFLAEANPNGSMAVGTHALYCHWTAGTRTMRVRLAHLTATTTSSTTAAMIKNFTIAGVTP